MNLINVRVRHIAKALNKGDGYIIAQTGERITVRFDSGEEAIFMFPQVFKLNMLIAVDEKIQNQIIETAYQIETNSNDTNKKRDDTKQPFKCDEREEAKEEQILEEQIKILKDRLRIHRMVSKKEMTKDKAISLLRKQGYMANNQNTTFASKNRGAEVYWANPDKQMLGKDWFLILNDCAHEMVLFFKIPQKSILLEDVKFRVDNDKKIDLQIEYGNISFIDVRSKIEFDQFLIGHVCYN